MEVTKLHDSGPAVASMVLAFGTDPFVRWLFPESAQYLSAFTQLAELHGARTAANGGAYGCNDYRGAAFWYPPGTRPDGDALGAIIERAGALERLMSVWAHVSEFEPDEPHWYLRQIGIDPIVQGTGRGGLLMQACLADIDARGELAYLEATSEPGVRLYERHGFTVLAKVQAGDSAPLWPMSRAPQRR